jgi:hypothetical protein
VVKTTRSEPRCSCTLCAMGDGAVPGKGDRVPAAFRLTKIGMGLMLGAKSHEKSAAVVNHAHAKYTQSVTSSNSAAGGSGTEVGVPIVAVTEFAALWLVWALSGWLTCESTSLGSPTATDRLQRCALTCGFMAPRRGHAYPRNCGSSSY